MEIRPAPYTPAPSASTLRKNRNSGVESGIRDDRPYQPMQESFQAKQKVVDPGRYVALPTLQVSVRTICFALSVTVQKARKAVTKLQRNRAQATIY